MQRRQFLVQSALFTAVSTMGFRAAPVAAADGSVAGIAAAQSFKIGEATVTALSDGFLPITADTLVGITPEEFKTLLAAAYIEGDAHPTGVNAYLIETGGTRVLVDTGTGTVFGPGLGHLPTNMAALGIDPASIDTIVATHLHPDHIGGIAGVASNPFVNASLVASQDDIAFWSSSEIKAQAPEQFRSFFDMAVGATSAFGDKVRAVTGEADLGNGLTAVPLPGHTPGHMGVMLESGGDSLLIWGDVIHVPPVQFTRPEVTIGFDTDQDMARKTRQSVLDQAATDKLRVAGMHIGFPGMGYVERAAQGYRFVPQPYPYG